MKCFDLDYLTKNLEAEQFLKLIEKWIILNSKKISCPEAIELSKNVTELLLKSMAIQADNFRDHARASENVASVALMRKTSLPVLKSCKRWVDKFSRSSFNNWDWFYEKIKEDNNAK